MDTEDEGTEHNEPTRPDLASWGLLTHSAMIDGNKASALLRNTLIAGTANLSSIANAVDWARKWTPPPAATTALASLRAVDSMLRMERLSSLIVPEVPKVDPAWFRIGRDYSAFFKTLNLGEPRRYFPDNWDPILADLDFALVDNITAVEGIPVAWTPGADILSAMLNAPNRDERVEVLLENQVAVLAGCDDVLAGADHKDLTGHCDLARESVAAYQSGFHAAGGALAIGVATAIAEAAQWVGDPKQLIRKIRISDDMPVALTIEYVTRAPLSNFLTYWRPGAEHPTAPSRHAVAHDVTREDLTDAAALVAIMMATSLIRTVQFRLDRAHQTGRR